MTEVGKKGSVSEEDVSSLLQRYTATTILSLLQEVSQFAEAKIDWNTLVKSTSTGISNAREYQMLWRHLAYRDSLLENIEDKAEPLDDDSDLEFEIEAAPAASPEVLSEAATCVKVLISSGSSHDSGITSRSSIEAPLTINKPNDQMPRLSSDKQQLVRPNRGTNVTVPVSVQKQPLPAGQSTEGLDGNGTAGSGLPAKKKRKLWTEEEDLELIAAVQKFGEGNWANILKGDFKHDRTASQLSQRWAIIRRRQANIIPLGCNKTISSTRSEEMLAAQKAFSLALDMPMSGSLSAIFSGTSSQPSNSSMFSGALSETPTFPARPAISETLTVPARQALNQHQQASNQATSQRGVSNLYSNKPRTTPRKSAAPAKPLLCPNPIQAAAFAAGGRIAAPSAAATLLKAAQSKNAVHIRPRGNSLSKSPATGANLSPATGANTLGAQTTQNSCQIRLPGTAPKLGRGVGLLLNSCVTASNLSTKQILPESNSGTLQGGEQKSIAAVSATDVDELLSEEVGGGDETQQKISESNLETLLGPGSQGHDTRTSKPTVSADDVDKLVSEEVGCEDEAPHTLSEFRSRNHPDAASQENGEQKSHDTVSATHVDELLNEVVGYGEETQQELSESNPGTLLDVGTHGQCEQKSKGDELNEEAGCGDETLLTLPEPQPGNLLDTDSQEQKCKAPISAIDVDELLSEEVECGGETQQNLSKLVTIQGSGLQKNDDEKRIDSLSAIDVDKLLSKEIRGDVTRQRLLESKPETPLGTGSQENGQLKSKAIVSAIDVEELSGKKDEGKDEMASDVVMAQDGQIGNSNLKLIGSEAAVNKAADLQKEAADKQVWESKETGSVDDVSACVPMTDEEQLHCIKMAGADEVK